MPEKQLGLHFIPQPGCRYLSASVVLGAAAEATGIEQWFVEWILDDYPYFTRTGALPSPELIFKVYKDEFDAAYEQRSMMILTMHPQTIGHRSRITHLDKLITYMKSKPGVWFATTEQIANYVKDTSKGK